VQKHQCKTWCVAYLMYRFIAEARLLRAQYLSNLFYCIVCWLKCYKHSDYSHNTGDIVVYACKWHSWCQSFKFTVMFTWKEKKQLTLKFVMPLNEEVIQR